MNHTKSSQLNLSFEDAGKKRKFLREVFDLTQTNGEFGFRSSYLSGQPLKDMTLDAFLEGITDEATLVFHINQYPDQTICGAAISDKKTTATFNLPTTNATRNAVNDAMLKCFGYDIARGERLMSLDFGLVSFPDISRNQLGRISYRDNSVLILKPYAPHGNVEDFSSAALYKGVLEGCVTHRRSHYLKSEDEGFWSAGKLTQQQLADYLRGAISVRRALPLKEQNGYLGALIRDSEYARKRLERGNENIFNTRPLEFPEILVGDPSVVLIGVGKK